MKALNLKFNKVLIFSVILGIVLVLWGLNYRIKSLKKANELQAIEISTLNDSVSSYKSKNGDLTFKIKSVTVENANKRKALEAAGFEIKELRARDIKFRDVISALNAKLDATGNGSTIIKDTVYIVKGDTIKSSFYKWNNGFLFLDGTIVDNKNDFQYKYKAKLSILNESKKNENIISIYIDDPNAEITNSNSITIKNKKKWWESQWLYGAAGLGLGYVIFK